MCMWDGKSTVIPVRSCWSQTMNHWSCSRRCGHVDLVFLLIPKITAVQEYCSIFYVLCSLCNKLEFLTWFLLFDITSIWAHYSVGFGEYVYLILYLHSFYVHPPSQISLYHMAQTTIHSTTFILVGCVIGRILNRSKFSSLTPKNPDFPAWIPIQLHC